MATKKHWIYIKRGLSEDPKHRAAMGECIWLFMHIIDRADWETGIARDWKDKDEAMDMSIPVDTLRRQRQKLEELDYIRCAQKQHGQDIYIMEWKNPRDYSSEIKNPRFQGSHKQPPSDGVQDGHALPPSRLQGLNQGSNQGLNQVQAQVKTPTSTSESRVRSQTSPDFGNMTVGQAYKVPTLKMFVDATGWLPADILWEQIHTFITDNELTLEQVKTAAVAWAGHGYNRRNVMGILEWAKNGIPANGQKPSGTKPPAVDETRVQETQKMLAEKLSGNFVARPDRVQRPRIGKPS